MPFDPQTESRLRKKERVRAFQVFLGTMFLIIAGMLVYGAFNPLTKKELKQQEARRAEISSAAAQKTALHKALCQARADCQKYGEARQACATAGNIDACTSIKVKDAEWLRYVCNDDGTISNASRQPNAIECIFSGIW